MITYTFPTWNFQGTVYNVVSVWAPRQAFRPSRRDPGCLVVYLCMLFSECPCSNPRIKCSAEAAADSSKYHLYDMLPSRNTCSARSIHPIAKPANKPLQNEHLHAHVLCKKYVRHCTTLRASAQSFSVIFLNCQVNFDLIRFTLTCLIRLNLMRETLDQTGNNTGNSNPPSRRRSLGFSRGIIVAGLQSFGVNELLCHVTDNPGAIIYNA